MKTITRSTPFVRRVVSFAFLLTIIFAGANVSTANAASVSKEQCIGYGGTCQTSDPGAGNLEIGSCIEGGTCYAVLAGCTGDASRRCAPAGSCRKNEKAVGACSATSVCCETVVSSTGDPGAGPKSTGDPGAGIKSTGDPGVGTAPTGTGGSGLGNVNQGESNISTPQAVSFGNPLQYNTVQDVLGNLLDTLRGIIVILSIIFIIIGAVLYITSAGDSKKVESAKSAITASMIGLALGIAAPSFLKEISGILGWNAAPAEVSGSISLTQILTNVLSFLTGIVGILSIIMLIIGALMMLTAAGNENQIDSGKKIVKYSVVGIIIAFAALVIVKQVAALFVV